MDSDSNSPWQYKHEGSAGANSATTPASESPSASTQSSQPSQNSISWTSVEYIEHQRGSSWYLLLSVLTILLAAAIYLITKDYFALGATVVAGIIVGAYAGRKPNQVTYELTNKSLSIGQKTYPYNLFKSFSVFNEGELSSLNLQPIKRLMPPVAAYFPPENEQKITDVIGDHLPYEEHKLDAIDRLTRRLRF